MPRPATAREMRYRDAYDDDIMGTSQLANRVLNDYSVDDAFQRRLAAAQSMFTRNIGRSLRASDAGAVSAGRLRTGFHSVDKGRIMEDFAQRFAEVSGNAALQTAGLDLQRLGLGADIQSRAMAARGGEYHTLRGQRLQDAKDKADRRSKLISDFLGLAGTGLGFFFGGPAGAAAGGAGGRALGGAVT